LDNPLKNLAIDKWYKAIIAVGAVLLIISLTVQLQANNQSVQLFAFGLFLVGIAEWINHPARSIITPPNAYIPQGIYTNYARHPKPLGIILDIIGIVALFISIYKLFLQ